MFMRTCFFWFTFYLLGPVISAQSLGLTSKSEVLDRSLVQADLIANCVFARGDVVWLGNVGTLNDGEDWVELKFEFDGNSCDVDCSFITESIVLAYVDNSYGDKTNIGLWQSSDAGVTWSRKLGNEYCVSKSIPLADGTALVSGINSSTTKPFLVKVTGTQFQEIPLPNVSGGNTPLITSGEVLDNGEGWVIGSWSFQNGGKRKEMNQLFPIEGDPFRIDWDHGITLPDISSKHGTYLAIALMDTNNGVLYERSTVDSPYISSIWITRDGYKTLTELDPPTPDKYISVTKCFWIDAKQIVFVNLQYALGGGGGAFWIFNSETIKWRPPIGEEEVNGWKQLEPQATSRNAAKILLAASMLSSEGHIDYLGDASLLATRRVDTKKKSGSTKKEPKPRLTKGVHAPQKKSNHGFGQGARLIRDR